MSNNNKKKKKKKIRSTILCFLGAYDYETDEWNSAYNQNVYASLNGKIRELVSADNGADADDTDTRFQPPRDNNNAHKSSVGEGYRIADSDDIIPSISVPVVNENILQRHARAVTWNVNSLQLTTVDGSGEIEDGSMCSSTFKEKFRKYWSITYSLYLTCMCLIKQFFFRSFCSVFTFKILKAFTI